LEKRAEKIENQFRVLFGLRTKTEQQFEDEPSAPVDRLEVKLRAHLQDKLEEGFGPAFWVEAVPADIRSAVDRKIESHVKSHPYDIEKLSSSEAKLAFLDIMDYEKVISSNWMLFAPIFQSRGELTKHFLALKKNPLTRPGLLRVLPNAGNTPSSKLLLSTNCPWQQTPAKRWRMLLPKQRAGRS
jgi:hypothetical protein